MDIPSTTLFFCLNQPDLVVDSAGNATAIWQSYDGCHTIIQSATLPFQGNWSLSDTISSKEIDAQSPQIAADSFGNAVAAWNIFDGNNSIIQVASRAPLLGWSEAQNISGAGNNASSVQIAMNDSGLTSSAVAVWSRFNGNNFIIQSATYPWNGGWSTVENISTSGQDALIPNVSIDPSGNVVAIWSGFDGANFLVDSAERLYEQSWSSSSLISLLGENSLAANVATDSAGNALASWNGFDGANYVVNIAERPFGGNWSAQVELSSSGQDAFSPQVAMSPGGNAVAIWIRFNGSHYIAQLSTKSSGDSWSAVMDLSNPNKDVNNVSISIDDAGNSIAVWDETDGTSSEIHAAKQLSEGSWIATEQLSTTGMFAYLPIVSVDPIGNAVAIWLQSNGSDYVVYGSTLPSSSY